MSLLVRWRFALLAIMCIGASTTVVRGQSPVNRSADQFGGVASTHIVVRLRASAFGQMRADAPVADGDALPLTSEAFRATAFQWRATKMRTLFEGPFTDRPRAAGLGMDRTFMIDVPAGSDTWAMAAAFAELANDVEFASVDTIGGAAADVIPNDPSFGVQYALHNTGQTVGGQAGIPDADIDAPAAWALHTGDLGTATIAIIDSGVNSHAEYGNNVAPYPNGRIVQGRNTDNPATPNLTTDGCPHGTHVAGIAAAAGDNGVGIAGVSWGAHIMPVRVLGTPNGCSGGVSALAAGIVWAADNGADVGNVSLQYYNLSPALITLLQDAIDYANAQGMLLVAAAGNTNSGPPNASFVAYPGRLPGCMAVSATDNRDAFASSFSRYGAEVDVCAPGDDIYSTWTGGNYVYLFGTSMSTPHVSGLAALIRSHAPGLPPSAIEFVIKSSSDDLGPTGWDDHFGEGRINAVGALLAARPPCDTPGPCDDGLFCTVDDQCAEGTCSGTTKSCADPLACTLDSCDESTDACVHLPDDSLCPQDLLFCNGAEFCDGNSGCVSTGTPCSGRAPVCCENTEVCVAECCGDDDCPSDGFTCTDDRCIGGRCPYAPQHSACEDGDRCTDDRCDASVGASPSGCTAFDNGLCGTCCHHFTGGCTDQAIAEECASADMQDQFFVGEMCAGVVGSGACVQHLGACCDQDTFGGCTPTAPDECSCPNCVWHKLRTCDEIACIHAAIPAMSAWGTLVLTLCLLIGAKVAFHRRTALGRSASGLQL